MLDALRVDLLKSMVRTLIHSVGLSRTWLDTILSPFFAGGAGGHFLPFWELGALDELF